MIDFNPIQASDTVFVGDSLTESFNFYAHFKRHDLRNRGVSGSLTDHVIYRMEEISNAGPARIFLMIGINDLFSGQDPEDILENTKKILHHFQETTSVSELFFQSILPVNVSKMFEDEGINLKIYAINHEMENYCKENSIQFINLHPEFLGMNGEMDARYTYDGVHLTDEGYTQWAAMLMPLL